MIPSKLYNYFNKKNIPDTEVERQYSLLKNGITFSNLLKPAKLGDGISQLSTAEIESFSRLYENSKKHLKF